jgi:hypothetical protein
VALIPTTGRLRWVGPAEPRNRALVPDVRRPGSTGISRVEVKGLEP